MVAMGIIVGMVLASRMVPKTKYMISLRPIAIVACKVAPSSVVISIVMKIIPKSTSVTNNSGLRCKQHHHDCKKQAGRTNEQHDDSRFFPKYKSCGERNAMPTAIRFSIKRTSSTHSGWRLRSRAFWGLWVRSAKDNPELLTGTLNVDWDVNKLRGYLNMRYIVYRPFLRYISVYGE